MDILLVRKMVSKTRAENTGEAIPYVSEFETQVLSILRKDAEDKEKVKELLEKYATRYSTEAGSGA
jgi:hypothetical protein